MICQEPSHTHATIPVFSNFTPADTKTTTTAKTILVTTAKQQKYRRCSTDTRAQLDAQVGTVFLQATNESPIGHGSRTLNDAIE